MSASPNCGSRCTPMLISIPVRAMRATSAPSMRAAGARRATSACIAVQALRTPSASARPEAHAARVALVRDVGRFDLEHHGVAERMRCGDRFVDRACDAPRRHRHAVAARARRRSRPGRVAAGRVEVERHARRRAVPADGASLRACARAGARPREGDQVTRRALSPRSMPCMKGTPASATNCSV